MRPQLEVADIFRRFGPEYRQAHVGELSLGQFRVMRAIEQCRTEALGGHVEQCDACGHQRISYNSCRNRHCPKCQSLARAKWLSDRKAELLPVTYFHVVFTLPSEIAEIAYQNKAILYDMLFQATAETLLTIAIDKRHLGAEIGFIAILHTWGQNLMHHPHLHCVVPGGGLASDYSRWISCRPGFFLPVRVLSRLFRRLFLERLQKQFDLGNLRFFGKLSVLSEEHAFAQHLAKPRHTDWVVYAKEPFGGPQQALDYLGRYTHRVAISNSRLMALENEKVAFRWKDYRREQAPRVMRLAAAEFMRRFLLHVLPSGLKRIRHYGFLSNRWRTVRLSACRRLLYDNKAKADQKHTGQQRPVKFEILTAAPFRTCPLCMLGCMACVNIIPYPSRARAPPKSPI
jgi:hypothetical protein